jgi:uncharacterized protein YjlB
MNSLGRRRFNAILATLNLGQRAFGCGESTEYGPKNPEVLRLSRNGWVPNNERLPTLIYRAVITPAGSGAASHLETTFKRNGWPPQWRNGVYSFHHYHSTAHEVLGIADGQARLMLGGENGSNIIIRAGDVLVLPAGTGHCGLESSSEFLVVGAYPPDQHWDICRGAPSVAAMQRMEGLAFPHSDPVSGMLGPLSKLWSQL